MYLWRKHELKYKCKNSIYIKNPIFDSDHFLHNTAIQDHTERVYTGDTLIFKDDYIVTKTK
jgi:hypothetical protein